MPKAGTLDAIVESAVKAIAVKIATQIEAAIATKSAVSLAKAAPVRKASKGAPRKRRGEELTKWVADKRARRVPTFVIKMTGLDTKKKIVAKYGENSTFEAGKPAPKVKLKAA